MALRCASWFLAFSGNTVGLGSFLSESCLLSVNSARTSPHARARATAPVFLAQEAVADGEGSRGPCSGNNAKRCRSTGTRSTALFAIHRADGELGRPDQVAFGGELPGPDAGDGVVGERTPSQCTGRQRPERRCSRNGSSHRRSRTAGGRPAGPPSLPGRYAGKNSLAHPPRCTATCGRPPCSRRYRHRRRSGPPVRRTRWTRRPSARTVHLPPRRRGTRLSISDRLRG